MTWRLNLLTAAEEGGFDILLTTDKNMPYQQNLAGRKIAVVILARQQWPQLRPRTIAMRLSAVGLLSEGWRQA